MVAGSNPAVPTFAVMPDSQKGRGTLDTLILLMGIVGFMVLIAIFFFGSFLLLDFIWGRKGGDP